MADKKKKQGKKKAVANEKQKSALARGLESSKKQRAAAIKAKPKNPTPQQKVEQEKQKRQGGLREYFNGVKIETKKVVWPTRKELVSYTIVVFIACAFFGLFLWGVDTGFLAVIREVFSISMN